MKRTFIFLVLFAFLKVNANTQLTGNIQNLADGDRLLINIPFDCWYYEDLSEQINPDKQGNFKIQLDIQKPQNIFLNFNDDRLLLYAEPGKEIKIAFDSKDLQGSLKFMGDLKAENEFRKESGLLYFSLLPEGIEYSMASAMEIQEHIKNAQKRFSDLLVTNSQRYSEHFQKITRADLEYVEHKIIWDMIRGPRKALRENRELWSSVLKQAHESSLIDNREAIESNFYQTMLAYYPRYINISSESKAEFQAKVQDILNKSFEEALAEIKLKGERYWEFKVMNRYFSGKVLEKLLASFIENGIRHGELDYLNETYNFFIETYPESTYRSYINELMEPVLKLNNNNSISFEMANPSIDTYEEIISSHKEKVVLIDLWGSWCGPCKTQFKYSADLKERFKDEPVDFVYIAFEYNRSAPEKIWKKTVNLYNLSGRHILADDTLKRNIELLYGSPERKSFPRYILVDKKGEIANLNAPLPSSQEELTSEIENLLN